MQKNMTTDREKSKRTLKLIELVKKNPELYRVGKNYKKNSKIWKAIAAELKEDVYECKRKWEALRVSYTKELRLQKGLERRGKMKAVRTGWYLTKEMSFLENCITRQKTKSDWSSSLEEYTDGNTTNSDTFDKIKEKTRISDITRPVRSESIPCTENISTADNTPTIENTPPLLVYINENRYNKKEIEEAEMAFFKGLLPQIQQLSRERKRRFERELLLKLHELLAEEEQELLNNFL